MSAAARAVIDRLAKECAADYAWAKEAFGITNLDDFLLGYWTSVKRTESFLRGDSGPLMNRFEKTVHVIVRRIA